MRMPSGLQMRFTLTPNMLLNSASLTRTLLNHATLIPYDISTCALKNKQRSCLHHALLKKKKNLHAKQNWGFHSDVIEEVFKESAFHRFNNLKRFFPLYRTFCEMEKKINGY